jgi:nicotinamidase-related amidase
MLMNKDESCLVLVDVQEKFIPVIHEQQLLVANCQWLLKLAKELAVPTIASEQYPKGIGPTIPPLKALISPENFVIKAAFSCTTDAECQTKINASNKAQIILAGIEAHVCILQTAFGLKEQGKQVFVVADAISSRDRKDKELAIARMQTAGINIVSKEMVFFEWLHTSAHPRFKELSKKFIVASH